MAESSQMCFWLGRSVNKRGGGVYSLNALRILYAAIVIAIVPSIVIYMLFQEQIISGLTAGAVKGE